MSETARVPDAYTRGRGPAAARSGARRLAGAAAKAIVVGDGTLQEPTHHASRA